MKPPVTTMSWPAAVINREGLPCLLRLLLAVALFGGLLFAGPQAARGQHPPEEELALREKGPPQTTGPIITDTTIPQDLGTFTLFVPTFLAVTTGHFSPNRRRVNTGGDYTSWSTAAQLYYGIAPNTEVYIVGSFLSNQAWNVSRPALPGDRTASFSGWGDVSITGKYLLLHEQPYLPAMAAIFRTSFPTGHHLHLNPGKLGTDQLGSGSFTFTPGLNFFKYLPPVLLYANFWYSMSTAATVGQNRVYYPDQITVNFALEYPFPGTRWVLLWELVSYYNSGRLFGHKANQAPQILLSTLPALEFILNKSWMLAAGVQIDLAGKNTTCQIAPNFSVFYSY